MMKISEVMTTDVETVTSDQTAREAAAFMLRADAGSIPVCDGGRVVGMITDRDIAVRGVAEGRGPDTPVSELMSDGVICAHEDDDVQDVARRMSDEQVRRIPVVDTDERLIGNVKVSTTEFGEVLGYENHSGQTTLGSGVRPLGTASIAGA